MQNLQSHTARDLQRLVEQIERLSAEQKALGDDIRDKLKEAKSKGLEPKYIRKVLALRKKSQAEREEEEAILAVYCHAVGLTGLPLGDYAERQEAAHA